MSSSRAEIEASSRGGRCYCAQVFMPSDIAAWAGPGLIDLDAAAAANAKTALCPQSGSESAIGDKSGFAVSVKYLSLMHEAWIARTIIYKPGARK